MTVSPRRLSLNSATVKHLGLREAVELCRRHGIEGLGVWREQLEDLPLPEASRIIRDAGLRVSSLCRGGFFTTPAEGREEMLADNRVAIEQAQALGAETLVLVCGGLVPGSRDLPQARELIADAITELVPVAAAAGVRLAVEALHPMFCADRCAISRLGQALELAQRFPPETVGIVVDAYHVWWDDAVLDVIARAGDRIASYQVADWVLPLPADVLLGRGHLGDGCIDFPPMTRAVEQAGYDGMIEVEIFNQGVWDAPPDDTAATVVERFGSCIAEELTSSGVGPMA